MISYHFLNQTTNSNFFTNDTGHGAGQLWSELPAGSMFQQHSVPFPIVTVDSQPSGSNQTGYAPLNNTVYEVTPFELGSWDPSLSAMTNLSHVGTHLNNGQPDNNTACVTGFDEAGFVMGTSSSLFNVGRL
jgi:lysophospholipase